MRPEIKQTVGIVVLIALSMVVLIWFANVARESHDAEVRKQTLETCKETK